MHPVNQQRLIETFVDLARISSPSWHEGPVIDYLAARLDDLGIPWQLYPCGESHNMLIRVEGTAPGTPVLFSGHLDTVTPCDNVKPQVTASRISSDGTTILGSDDKCAVAQFLEGLRVIRETGMPHGPIEVLLSCAEEIGLKGAAAFDTSALRARHAFVFDSGGSVGTIVLRAPYQITMAVTVRGKAAHAGMEPEKGISAIMALADIIHRLPSGRIDAETTANVGTISGGRATNIVAQEAFCRLEVRSLDRKKLARVEKQIRDIIRQRSTAWGARAGIARNLEYEGFSISQSDFLVKTAAAALGRLRIRPRFVSSGGGSDTNILNRAGIRAVNLSCGMQKVHTTDEFILTRDLVRGAELMLAIVEEMRVVSKAAPTRQRPSRKSRPRR